LYSVCVERFGSFNAKIFVVCVVLFFCTGIGAVALLLILANSDGGIAARASNICEEAVA